VWWSKSEVYPIIGCMGVALGWCAFMSGRHLFTSPDVSFDRERRGSALKDAASEGVSWYQQHQYFVAKDFSKISIMNSFERKLD